jgi:hypothetical protein
MPAIKVYKHNGIAIPVDVAKTAKAYCCPFTGEIVLTKRSYVSHLKDLRQKRMWRKARNLRHQRRLEEMWNLPTFEGIVKWITVNSDVIWQNGKQNGWSDNATRWNKIRDDFQIEITYLDLHWLNSLSNSHSCPHNGKTNWCSNGDKHGIPKGYPGWGGRIEFKISHDVPSFSSDLFKGTRIHTGTGGIIGNKTYSYDVKFFDADWPGVTAQIQADREQYEKDHLIDMIKNQYKPFVVPHVKIGKPR